MELVARGLVLRAVVLEERVAGLEPREQGGGVLLPEHALLGDPAAAVDDHLLGDLRKQRRHALGRRIVPCDRVHHPQVVQQPTQALDDLRRRGRAERLDVLVERGEVLDVVLGLVERVRDRVVLGSPHLVLARLARMQHQHDLLAVLAAQVVADRVELRRALAPPRQLGARPDVVVVVRRRLGLLIQELGGQIGPLAHARLVLVDDLGVGRCLRDGRRPYLDLDAFGLRQRHRHLERLDALPRGRRGEARGGEGMRGEARGGEGMRGRGRERARGGKGVRITPPYPARDAKRAPHSRLSHTGVWTPHHGRGRAHAPSRG